VNPFKRIGIPHVLVLLTAITIIGAAATWVIPSGHYRRATRTVEGLTREMVVPGTYEAVPKRITARGVFLGEVEASEDYAHPVGALGCLTAIPRGLEQSADIVFFIFLIGGTFGILQRSGTIPATIGALLRRFGHSAPLLTVMIMFGVAVGGSTLGMGEEFIPLIPVFLIISQRLGYDRIYGLALVMLAADIGFAAATTNPFTVNIAQAIAEVPINSGLTLRILFFVCAMTLTIGYVLRYGAKIRRDPQRSLVADIQDPLPEDNLDDHRLTGRHMVTLITSVAIFALILYGVQSFGWWLNDMAGGFFLMGIVAAIVCRMPLQEATRAYLKGMEDMVVAALAVGFARGITVVLTEGQILDTLIHSAATVLSTVSEHVAVMGMFAFQSTLNFLVPSGSGQAAVTMPLMAPLADVLGLTRQTAVLAFQFGDGLSNTIIPTSGVLMAMLALARIPYQRWLRFALPLFAMLSGLAAVFLAVAVAIEYR
jgi:uncharacterized ion transporter superfamily protein YfcC